MSGDEKTLANNLESILLSSFPSFDFGDEKNYQIMILSLISVIFPDFIVKSEVNEGSGRCDIMISSKEEKGLGAIIEVKLYLSKASMARLKVESDKALEQIRRNDYAEELRSRGSKPILAYGIVFFAKKAIASFTRLD